MYVHGTHAVSEKDDLVTVGDRVADALEDAVVRGEPADEHPPHAQRPKHRIQLRSLEGGIRVAIGVGSFRDDPHRGRQSQIGSKFGSLRALDAMRGPRAASRRERTMVDRMPVARRENWNIAGRGPVDPAVEHGNHLVPVADGESAAWQKVLLHVDDEQSVSAAQIHGARLESNARARKGGNTVRGMASPAGASHVFEAHTAEVRLHLWGADLASLFEEAARALAELMLGDDPHGLPGPPEPVSVDALDRAALLAAWINELLFLSETKKQVWVEARVTILDGTHLTATVRGVEPQAIRTAVKAATLHDLRVEACASGGFEATLVLDV